MSEEIKEILEEFESLFDTTEAPEDIINDFNKIKNYIINLQKIADSRMNTILKIEQYLIECGVDDDTLKYCNIYDVNGVELKKYIEELKGDDKE